MEEKLVHEYKKLESQVNFKYISKKIRINKSKNLNKWIYYFKVWEITELNLVHVEDSYKRSSFFHVDHIISIHLGYENGVLPEIIGSIDNLQIITHEENFKKGTSITLKSIELIKKFGLHIYFRDKAKPKSPSKKYEKRIIKINEPYIHKLKKQTKILPINKESKTEDYDLKKIIDFVYSDGFSLC